MEKKALKDKELVGGVSYIDDLELASKGVAGCDGNGEDPKRLLVIIKPEG